MTQVTESLSQRCNWKSGNLRMSTGQCQQCQQIYTFLTAPKQGRQIKSCRSTGLVSSNPVENYIRNNSNNRCYTVQYQILQTRLLFKNNHSLEPLRQQCHTATLQTRLLFKNYHSLEPLRQQHNKPPPPLPSQPTAPTPMDAELY